MSSNTSDNTLAVPLPQDMPQTAETAAAEKHTYSQILKSSALIGGSSVVNILTGIIRTKAMAVLLGPAGFGLMSVYGSIADLAQSIAGMGINSSGVRQIAEAVGTGEQERIARTAAVLRRTSVFLGILGAILLVLFSAQVSILTFGDDQHSAAVALLSLAVFFRLVSAGQGALIQGMRRISDLARMGILGGLFGTVISIVLVYFLRERGVVPALVGIAVAGLITSWWYSRKVEIEPPSMTLSLVRQEASGLLKLGFAFMVSGFLMMGAGYAVRTMVLRMVGLEAAGFYSAAWTLGGLYVGFILQAMGADFYPRLTAVARDNTECNRLVNEQAQISLLLAGPGVIATLTFAPVVIALFYSAKFHATVEILRWICLGMTLRVITWPMGFIILAKGASKYLYLDRNCLDRRQRRSFVGMFEIFRFERRRHCLLRVVRLSRTYDLSDRTPAQRFSLVVREQKDRSALPDLDRLGVLRVLHPVAFIRRRSRDSGSDPDQRLLDSNSRQPRALGPDSKSLTAMAGAVRSYNFRLLDVYLLRALGLSIGPALN